MLDFGDAIRELKKGNKVSRQGWNGKGMYLLYVQSNAYGITEKINLELPKESLLPWVGMKTADNKFVPWLASQTDILAEDWVVIDK